MGEKDGIWYCDVCNTAIPTGQKRYPLDAGRICCAECWAEIKDTLAERGASAPEVKRSEESKHITLQLFGDEKVTKAGRTVNACYWAGVAIGGHLGGVIGCVVGDLGVVIIGFALGLPLGAAVGYAIGMVLAKPEE